MSHILFNCPECKKPLKLSVDLAGPSEFIICPCCDRRIRVPQSDSHELKRMPTVIQSRTKKSRQEKAAVKNIFFDCPECGRPLKLPPGIAGTGDMVMCPKCDKEIRIPEDDLKPPPPEPTVVKKRTREKSKEKKCRMPWKPAQLKRMGAAVPLRTKLIVSGAGLVVAIALAVPFRIWVVKACSAKIDRFLDFCSSYGKVTYQDIDISPLGHEVRLKDIVIKPEKALRSVSISYLVLQRFSPRRGVPPRLDIEAYGVHIPLYPETFGKAGPGMRALDYNCISSRITCSYRYDSDDNKLTISDMFIRSPAVGDIALSVELSNINLGAKGLTLKSLISTCTLWEIGAGRLEYSDDSFIHRFLTYEGKYIGETFRELHDGMLADLTEVISKEADPFTKKSLTEFGKFVRNSEHIIVTASPEEPVSVFNLKNTYDEKGIIGLIPELKLSFLVR